MNALLLAAGKGTRLRPLTEHTPKCLVTIGDVPLIDLWLKGLSEAGFSQFLVNTHHLAAIVESHLSRHALRDVIRTVYEPELLGTGGTLKANENFCNKGTTLIAHADNFCLCDWGQFVLAHKKRPEGTLMTMMTFETTAPDQCGIVELNAQGVVCSFHEKVPNPPGNLANAAVYLIEPALIDFIASLNEEIQDISTQLLPKLLGRIYTWQNRHTLIDIGSPERLAVARALNHIQEMA